MASKVDCWAQIPTTFVAHSGDLVPLCLSHSICKMEIIPPTSKAYCNDDLRDLVPGTAKGLLLFIIVIIKDYHLDFSHVTRWVKIFFCSFFFIFLFFVCAVHQEES